MTHARTPLRRSAPALAALLAPALLAWSPAPAQAAEFVDWGRTKAADQRFHQDCHPYRYRYRIDPPSNDWMLETFLRGPGGKPLASDQFLAASDPLARRATFRVCGVSTQPGRFTIRAKVTYREGFDEYVVKLRPTRFRITRG